MNRHWRTAEERFDFQEQAFGRLRHCQIGEPFRGLVQSPAERNAGRQLLGRGVIQMQIAPPREALRRLIGTRGQRRQGKNFRSEFRFGR